MTSLLLLVEFFIIQLLPSTNGQTALIEPLLDTSFNASSFWDTTYLPHLSRFSSTSAWGPFTDNPPNEWLQIDLGLDYVITSISTKGSGADNEFVKTFQLNYATNTNPLPTIIYPQTFQANTNRNSVVENTLLPPFIARYLRFYPLTSKGWPAMRVEAFGYIGTLPPTKDPTQAPTNQPTQNSIQPSKFPTKSPTLAPIPTQNPTNSPTTPTSIPTKAPTYNPSNSPTRFPSKSPTHNPSITPSKNPTKTPTNSPTAADPSISPSYNPSITPSKSPTVTSSNNPTNIPTEPSKIPTKIPSIVPTDNPIQSPTNNPISKPTKYPTPSPSDFPFCNNVPVKKNKRNAGFIDVGDLHEKICEFCVCGDANQDSGCAVFDKDNWNNIDSFWKDLFMEYCELDSGCSFEQVTLKKSVQESTECGCDIFECQPIGNQANLYKFQIVLYSSFVIVILLLL